MKLRLTQKGFDNYTGQMGVVFFENSLSTTDVSVLDATRMSAVMSFEWEDGSAANIAQHLLDRAGMTAPVSSPSVSAVETNSEPTEKPKSYTEADLAAIADAKGIAGLREISEPLGVKGNSIRGLIDSIVQATK